MEKLTLYGFYENKLSCNFCVYPRSFLVFGETPRITKLTGLCGWDVPGADPAKYQEDYVQTGAPAEAQHSRFGGERSSGEMSEPCPQDEAKDMEYGTTMGGMTLG